MASAGSITVSLLASTGSFETDMGRAERRMKKVDKEFTASARAIAGAFAPLGAAIAGVFSIGVMVNFTRAAVNGVDALNDLADATGTSVENASALDEIARRTGGSLDQVTGILTKFNQTLLAAKPGSGADQVLKQIGLNAEELKRIDPAEALRRTAVALDKFANDGNRARAMQELFGESVRHAAPFLADLAAQGKLNATVTTEQAKAAEEFNKNLFELQANVNAVARDISGPMVSGLNELAKRYKATTEAGGGFLEFLGRQTEIGRLLGVAVVPNAGGATGSWGEPDKPSIGPGETEQQKALKKFFEQNATAAEKFTAELAKQKAALGDLFSPEIEKRLRARFFPVSPTKAPKADKTGIAAEDPLDAFRRSELEATEAVNRALESSKWAAWEEDRTEKLKAAAAAQDRLNALIADTPTGQLEKQRETMKFLADQFERGAFGAMESAEAVAKYGEAANAALGNLPKLLEENDEFAKRMRENVQDSLGDNLYEAMNGNFKNIGDSFQSMVQRLVAEALAADLMDALFGDKKGDSEGMLGGMLGKFTDFLGLGKKAGGGSSGIGGLFGSLGDLFGGFFADGGTPPLGKVSIVGEDGPEAFVPRTVGTILPADQTAQLRAGGGRPVSIVQNFAITGPVDRRSQQQIATEAGLAIQRALARNA